MQHYMIKVVLILSLHTKNHFKASGALIYGLWCLMLFSTIFQLYRGSLFYWWSKPENPEKTTDRSQITDNLYHVMLHRKHPTISGIRTHNFSALISDKPYIRAPLDLKWFLVWSDNINYNIYVFYRVEGPLLALGWKRTLDKYDEKFRLKWVECKTRINYGGFKEGMKLFSYCSPWCGGYDSHITPIAI
jgi:hypothetical protein